MSKSYIVTGHQGFIGSHYYESIDNVLGFDISNGKNLCDPDVVAKMPACDVIVHMASINGTRLFYETPLEVAFNNTIPTINLLKKYNATSTKFVYTSTCEIFNSTVDNNLHPVPTDETVSVMFENINNPRWSYSCLLYTSPSPRDS